MFYPNFAARIFPSQLCIIDVDKRASKFESRTLALGFLNDGVLARKRKWLSSAASNDLFSLGQNFLAAGTQTLEKLGRQFQPPPEGFPAGPVGDVALRMLSNPLTFLEDLSRSYGPIVGMVLGGERVVLISDPAAAEQILISGSEFVAKEGTAFFPGSKLAGNGLLVSDGALWQRQRQLSNPAFRRSAVESYMQAMAGGAEELVNRTWRGHQTREVYADFNALTLQIVTNALFGFQASTPDSVRVTAAVRVAMEYFASRAASGFAIPEWLPTPDNMQYTEAVSRLDDVVYRIISQRRQQSTPRAAGSSKCLLDNLLEATDESGQGMSDQALRDELMTLLIAGQETSAIVLAWTCALLAHNPAQQSSVQTELDDMLGGNPPTPQNIGKLHMVEAVLLESLRLLPPAYLVGRCTVQPIKLGSCSLPRGTTVLVSPYLLHRNPQRWVQSQEFRPQRWLEHLKGSKPGAYMSLFSNLGPNGAYLPFGAGPRNCIGNYFAMAEGVLVLTHILRKYSLKPVPGQPFPAPDAKITLRPTSVHLTLEPR